MTTIYNALKNNFTQVSNHALLDIRLSGKAYKLYAYMCYRIGLSESWQFNKGEILQHFKEGEKAMRSAFDELIKSGFLERKRVRNDKGIFEKTDYIIYAEPVNIDSTPQVQNRHVDNRRVENPRVDDASYNNKERNNKDSKNKNLSLKSKPEIAEIIEREKLNLDLEIFYKWYEAEMSDKGLKGSLLNVMRSMAEKPRNHIKNATITESKEITDLRRKIKSSFTNQLDYSLYFGGCDIDLKNLTIFVKNPRALEYQELLNELNLKIELKK